MRRSSAVAAPTAAPPMRHRHRVRPLPQIEAVHGSAAGADDQLVVERAQPGGGALELP